MVVSPVTHHPTSVMTNLLESVLPFLEDEEAEVQLVKSLPVTALRQLVIGKGTTSFSTKLCLWLGWTPHSLPLPTHLYLE